MRRTTDGEGTASGASRVRRDLARLLYVGAVVVLAVYALTLLTGYNGHGWPLSEGALIGTFEIALALGCLARALSKGRGRVAIAALGGGLLALALGGILVHPVATPSAPSVADGLSLLLYPLGCAALVLFLRAEARRIRPTVWIDGVIAGLGVAAVCTAVALNTVLRAVSGSPLSKAVHLASPIGAFVLFALAMGVVVMVPWHLARTLLFATGCGLLAVGNVVALHQGASGIGGVGSPLDLLWPAALTALSASVWLRSRATGHSALVEKAPRAVVLTLVLAASPVILILGNVRHVNPFALILAGTTLLATAARMTLSLRQLRAVNESRQHQAVTDELTGLGNRRYLLEELQQSLAALPPNASQARGLALLLIDLDHFKEINDSFGHQTGDELLRQIGPRIRQVVRREDLVARLGGDEFAVLLYGANAYKATTVAQRIATLLEQPIDVSTASLHVGASIGVALAPEHATTAADLLRCADIAMYRAKAERGSFDVYEAALDDESDRFALIEDLRMAMEEGSLALHYQPEIDLRTGEVVTVEALLRWPHPTLGLIPPEHLLALAEESGHVHTLASWVFEEAIADCARWWHGGNHAAVAVNLLATDLLDSSLPQRVGELLKRSELPPHALVLEITEGMVVADLTRSKRVIQGLTDAGILVSIDDFGTGFSSLSHLNELAVGELKLDRTFTSRLQTGESGGRDEDIVSSIINLGHALGLRVVAEGIERPEFVSVLAALGCDAGQGYAIQTPCPPADIDFARRRRSDAVNEAGWR